MSQTQAQFTSTSVFTLFLYGAIPLFLYGINLILFAIGMFLLKQRIQQKGISFHIVSAVVLFGFMTAAAILTTVQVAAESGALSTVNSKTISAGLFILILLNELTVFIILLHRCLTIWGRNYRIVVLPTMLEVVSIALYSADWHYMVEVEFGSTTDSNQYEAISKTKAMLPVLLMCSALANTLLTLLIAGRIWWHKRRIIQAIRNNPLSQGYNSVIAMIIESGLIIPVFYIISIAVSEIQAMTPMLMITAMDIQILSLGPLLIIVRVGLGRTIEKDHIETMTLPHVPSTGANNEPMTFATSNPSMTVAPSGVVSLPHLVDDIDSGCHESRENSALGTVEPEKPPAL